MGKQDEVCTYAGWFSASKRKVILTQATVLMHIEDILLGEVSQIQEEEYYDSTCMRHPE